MKKILFIFILALGFVAPNIASAQPEKYNPVVWKTDYAKFSSSNFYIRMGGSYFFGAEPVDVHSDPGTERSTLEMTWHENSAEMRLFLYFRKTDNNTWEMYEARTYNGTTPASWIYYQESLGNTIGSLVNQRSYAEQRIFVPTDGTDAQIYCKDCSITAFIKKELPVSKYGYSLGFGIGIPANQTVTISTDPNTGYGVNAILKDSGGEVVTDQGNFSYQWRVENEAMLALKPDSIPYPDNGCAYGILPPCPPINAQLKGLAPGITRVFCDVIDKTKETPIVSNSFDVRVIENASPTPVSSQDPTPRPTNNQGLEKDMNELRGEVGKINLRLQEQKENISVIKLILNRVIEFLDKLFPFFRK